MAKYERQNFVNNSTTLTAEHLNHIEDGIKANEKAIEEVDKKIPADYAPKEHTHSQYLTEHQRLDDYAKKNELPTKTSQLTNDSDFVTKAVTDELSREIANQTSTFYVNISGDEESGYTADKTITEICEAHNNGMIVFANMIFQETPLIMPMFIFVNEYVCGFNVLLNSEHYILLITDGEIMVQSTRLTDYQDYFDHQASATRHITSEEREAWNKKSNFSGSYNDLTNKPNITNEVNTALATAKANGDFKGDTGARGTAVIKTTTAPSSYTTAIGDYTPKYRIALSTVKSQGQVSEVLLGDIISYSFYHYQVDYLDSSYAYISKTRVSIRGASGSDATVTTENITNALGYTPANAENVSTLSNEIDNLGGNIPDYVISEAESVIDKVVSNQGTRTFTFAVITDMHYGGGDYYDGILHASQGLKYIKDRVPLDCVFMLGDNTDGNANTTYENFLGDVMAINRLFDTDLNVQGNHDYYETHSPLIARLIYANNKNVVWGNRLGGYWHRDYDDFKLRVIGVNTAETGNQNVNISSEQLQWFVDTLDLSSKSDASDWQILVVSHHPLDWYEVVGNYPFAYVLQAYKDGTSWTSSSFGVTCNFANKNQATLIGNMHGHIHNFMVDYLYKKNPNNTDEGQTNVLRFAMPNGRVDGCNHYSDTVWKQDTTYEKTKNSAKDTSFCVCCLDLDTNTLKAFCYGAGYDRVITYVEKEALYTNQIPLSTDTDGNVFNGKGYIEGKRVNSSYTLVDADNDATGFIPIKENDILRLKNVAFNIVGSDNGNSSIAIYDSNKAGSTRITASNMNSNGFANGPYAKVDSNGNLIELNFLRKCENSVVSAKTAPTYYMTTGVMAYIRVTGVNIDDTSIITVNQEIRDEPPSYTNLIPLAIGSDGNPYNGGLGYKKGYRLNSSGSEVGEGDYFVTGFIPIKNYDYVYLKHMNFIVDNLTNQPNTRIATYDASFNKLRVNIVTDFVEGTVSYITNTLDEQGGTVATGDAVGKFRWCTDDNTAYIRFSTRMMTPNSIVTVNEEIE